MADLDVMRDKFIGLAEAFPQDKYTWRPMDGVRSVSEVLMLIASEGYGFAPTSLGGEAAMSRDLRLQQGGLQLTRRADLQAALDPNDTIVPSCLEHLTVDAR